MAGKTKQQKKEINKDTKLKDSKLKDTKLKKSVQKKEKLLVSPSGRKFIAKNCDLHTQYGMLREADIKNANFGDSLKTNKGIDFFVIPPGFLDYYFKIKRTAQIIPLKDIGTIITETGMSKDSIVLDSGSGSGGLACFIAHLAKKVYTYDIREDHLDTVRKNKEFLKLKNLEIFNGNIYEGTEQDNIDVMILDLPEPWLALKTAIKCLNVGGYLVSYSPHIPQATDFVNAVRENKNFIYLRTIEIIERDWEIEGRKVRPCQPMISHSGFISFARLVRQ
jgi:tRNA (adenine57-N1/adenine58-N1)-methyltransferase